MKYILRIGNDYYDYDDAYMYVGSIGDEKVCLPLRQFLKVKKSQLSTSVKSTEEASVSDNNNNNNNNSGKNNLLIGDSDPEAFVDPFLGVLMREPVLLTSSQMICDRSVALQCVLRRGRVRTQLDRLFKESAFYKTFPLFTALRIRSITSALQWTC